VRRWVALAVVALFVAMLVACGALLGVNSDDGADAGQEASPPDASTMEAAPPEAGGECGAPDFQNDPANCGSCGRQCSQACEAGACQKTVFATSLVVAGNLAAPDGGPVGGDAICNALARAAKLSGSYRAWIVEPNDAGPGLPENDGGFRRPSRPYVRTDGVLVALSFDALIDAGPINPIDHFENGAQWVMPVGLPTYVWTGTTFDGLPIPSTDCTTFTTGLDTSTGVLGAVDPGLGWDSVGGIEDPCDQPHGLYCFEQ
jgi:hypothetical protein